MSKNYLITPTFHGRTNNTLSPILKNVYYNNQQIKSPKKNYKQNLRQSDNNELDETIFLNSDYDLDDTILLNNDDELHELHEEIKQYSNDDYENIIDNNIQIDTDEIKNNKFILANQSFLEILTNLNIQVDKNQEILYGDQIRKFLSKNDEKMFKEELAIVISNYRCANDTLNMLSKNINNLDNKNLKELVSNEFYNINVLKNVQCLIENTYYTSPFSNIFTVDERKRLHISNIIIISEATAYSRAYLAKYNKELNIVIKESLEYYNNFTLAHEAFVGLYAINSLRAIIPNFMYTYGLMAENKFINRKFPQYVKTISYLTLNDDDDKAAYKKLHLVVESIDKSVSLDDFIMKIDVNFNIFINVFMQILYALENAQHLIDFTHYDLHSGNILISKKTGLSNEILYQRANGENRYVSGNYLATIIDFGFTHVKVDNKDYGINRNYYSGNKNALHPLFDIYKLLGFISYNYLTYNSKPEIEKFNLFLEKVWQIFTPDIPWKTLVTEQRELRYNYVKNIDKNPYLMSVFVEQVEDILEENFSINFTKKISDNILYCNNTNCKNNDEILEYENLKINNTSFTDIISVYDYYHYASNDITVLEFVIHYVTTDYFKSSFKNEFNKFNKLLDNLYDNLIKASNLLKVNSMNVINIKYKNTATNIANGVYTIIEILHYINQINFDIKILNFYVVKVFDIIDDNTIKHQYNEFIKSYYQNYNNILTDLNIFKEDTIILIKNNLPEIITKITNKDFILDNNDDDDAYLFLKDNLSLLIKIVTIDKL